MSNNDLYNWMESDEYGRDRYGPYDAPEEAEAGYFRLLVSATVTYRDDEIDRCVYGAGGADAYASDQEDATWTEDYQRWLCDQPTDTVLEERRRYEEGLPSAFEEAHSA